MKFNIELSSKEAKDALESGIFSILLNSADESKSEHSITISEEPVETVQETTVRTQEPTTEEPKAVPTVSKVYTMDELAIAATGLMDKGKTNDLMALINSFNIASLVELPQDRYNDFALKLRELGGDI